jgi:hypothetical protein
MLEVIPSELYIKGKGQTVAIFGRQFTAGLILC